MLAESLVDFCRASSVAVNLRKCICNGKYFIFCIPVSITSHLSEKDQQRFLCSLPSLFILSGFLSVSLFLAVSFAAVASFHGTAKQRQPVKEWGKRGMWFSTTEMNGLFLQHWKFMLVFCCWLDFSLTVPCLLVTFGTYFPLPRCKMQIFLGKTRGGGIQSSDGCSSFCSLFFVALICLNAFTSLFYLLKNKARQPLRCWSELCSGSSGRGEHMGLLGCSSSTAPMDPLWNSAFLVLLQLKQWANCCVLQQWGWWEAGLCVWGCLSRTVKDTASCSTKPLPCPHLSLHKAQVWVTSWGVLPRDSSLHEQTLLLVRADFLPSEYTSGWESCGLSQ